MCVQIGADFLSELDETQNESHIEICIGMARLYMAIDKLTKQ